VSVAIGREAARGKKEFMDQRVLLLSTNRELISLRTAVVRAAGFDADAARSKKEALSWLRERRYVALVIGWSISAKSAAEYIAIFRDRNPQGCVVYVSKTPWEKPDNISADNFITGSDGPQALIEAVTCRRFPL
jgi:CheY-like chemotaxis protein